MNFDSEKSNPDNAESQLDQETSDSHKNPADIPIQTLWDQAESNDKFALQILKTFCSEACYYNRIPLTECEECQNFLYFYKKKYVLNSNCLCLQIIQLAHDSTADDHLRRVKCYELISWAYWWLNIYKYIQCFMWNCHVCTRSKPSRQKTQGWLHPLPVSECCWHNVFIDYVGPLPPSTFMDITYWYVLVFVDCLTKMRHLILITSMKIEEVIECFYVHVWKHHGLPEFLVSDKGTQFTSDIWQHLYQMLKIDVKLFTVYHPEMDEQTERVNAVMKHYLWAFVNYMQNDWVKWLSGAEFSANNVSSLIILVSPLLVNSRQNPHLGFKSPEPLPVKLTVQVRIKLLNVKEFTKKMKELTEHL